MDTIPSRDVLMKVVAQEVSEDKLRDAVVYLHRELLQPGDSHHFGRENITVAETSALLFIDLVPMANWSHDCVYLLFDGKNTRAIQANFPPDGEHLLLLQKPEGLESWAVLSQERFE